MAAGAYTAPGAWRRSVDASSTIQREESMSFLIFTRGDALWDVEIVED